MVNHSFSSQELQRYSRQINLIGLSGQQQLKNARVLCVGLGGLGSSLLLYLAAAGIGRLGLVDADSIELSNLHRQVLYRVSQVSSAKTASAVEQILALNPAIAVDTYQEKLTQENAMQLINQYDIVADCSDNFYTNYLINDNCFKLRKPYVYASVTQFQGYCSLFNGTEGPCLRCLFPTPPQHEFIPTCDAAGILGVVPGLLGTIQATEIIKWIVNTGQLLEKRLLIIDLLQMAFKQIQLVQNPDCQLCMHHQPLPTLNYPAISPDCRYSITSEEMVKLLQEHKVTLIDVRSAAEHQMQNIGGKLLPLTELPNRLHELNPHHMIILYCHSGKRSKQALRILLDAGFPSVKYLRDG